MNKQTLFEQQNITEVHFGPLITANFLQVNLTPQIIKTILATYNFIAS